MYMYIGATTSHYPGKRKSCHKNVEKTERTNYSTDRNRPDASVLLTNRAMTKSTDTEQLNQWFPTCELDSRDSLEIQVAMTTVKSQIKQPSWLINGRQLVFIGFSVAGCDD